MIVWEYYYIMAATGDIKRIFDFGDVVLTHEAASALYNDILRHSKKQVGLITDKSQHLIPPLSLLWDYLSDSSVVTSRACGCILVQLAKTKVLDVDFALQQLLNLAKLAKRPNSILQSLTDLLITLPKSQGDVLPSAHIYQHPLFQFYRIQPSLITEVLACIGRVGNALGFSAVLPLVSFLVLTPDLDTYHKSVIFTWLCDHIEGSNVEAVLLRKVYRFLPQTPDFKPLSLFLKFELTSSQLSDTLAFSALEEISAFDTMEMSDHVMELSYLEKAALLMKSDRLESFSLRFSSCLLRLPYDCWKAALKIVEHAWNHLCPLYANLFFTPLVSLNLMIGQLRSIGWNEEDFLLMPKLIQSCLLAANTKSLQGTCAFHGNGSGNHKSLLDALCGFPKTVSPFLCALLRFRLIPNEATLNLLSSLLILHRDDKETASACSEVIVRMAAADPAKVSMVLPAFIQAASMELSATETGKTTISDFLPKLAVHHICTPTILRFILGLVNGQKTRLLGYRLLGNLFEKQPFIYHQIKSLFEDVAAISDEQLLLLKMELLFVVCKISGAEHSDDLTAILSSVINKCEATTDAMERSLTLAIVSLGELCRCEGLRADVTWRKLHGKLSKSTGQLHSALCEFAGILGETSEDEDSSVSAKTQVLQFLWKLASSSKSESSSRTAALRALSKFDFRHVDRSQLGIEVMDSEEATEDTKGLPGNLIFSVFESLENGHLEAFSLLVSKLISAETEMLGRGAYYNAKLMAAKRSTSSSSLEEFCASLTTKFSQGGGFASDKNVAAAVLLVYEPPEEPSPRRGSQVMRKSIVNTGRHYLNTFGELLKAVPFGETLNWRRALVVPFGWIKFLERMYLAMMISRRTELELARRVDLQQEMELVHMWARDKIVECLKTTWRQDGEARPNCCLALAALCLAVKDYATNNLQAETISSSGPYIDNRHWIILVAETLFGLAATGYTPMSQDLIFELLGPAANAGVINASRLGNGILLPAVRDDVSVFYSDRAIADFGSFLANERPADDLDQSSTDYSAEFYKLLSLGLFYGERVRQGAPTSHAEVLFPDNYRNIGGWLGAAVYAVLVDDVAFAEALLDVMIAALGKMGPSTIDQEVAVHVIGIVSMVTYPDSGQFIRSVVASRLNAFWLGDDTSGKSTSEMPGFLARIYGTAAYQQSVSTRLSNLSKENASLSAIADDFRWLCSSSGADCFSFAYAGRKKKMDADDRAILNDLCKFAKKRLLSSEVDDADLTFRGECLLTLGTVAFSAKCAAADASESTLPNDYSYLDESSVLRCSVAFLLNGCRTEQRVRCILNALTSLERTKALPPLDWDHVHDALDADIRAMVDEEITKLAIRERAGTLLAKLTHPTTVLKLSSKAKLHILENLHSLAYCLPTNVLKRLLRVIPRLKGDGDVELDSLLTASFKGLRLAFSHSVASDNKRPISTGNLAALSGWCLEICPFLRVDSYNDFRVPMVQRFVDALVEVESEKVDNLVQELKRRSELFAFSIEVSILLRRPGMKLSLDKVDRLVGAYIQVDTFRASALRVLIHELASGAFQEKEKEESVLHLMNSILLLCKRNESGAKGQDKVQILSTFDVFLVSVSVWFRDRYSLPLYLLDETKTDSELNAEYDSDVQTVLFADAAFRFARYLCSSNNGKLVEKVIDWAFQLLPTAETLGNVRVEVISGILQHCRSTECYIRKMRDPTFAEKISLHALGMQL